MAADPELRAHVPVARRAQHALLQAAHDLVQEREHEPLLGDVHVDRPPRANRLSVGD